MDQMARAMASASTPADPEPASEATPVRPAAPAIPLHMPGVVKRLIPEKGFGFIAGVDGIDRFFHRSDLATGPDADGRELFFPSNICTCNHNSFDHVSAPGTVALGRCTATNPATGDRCACMNYVRQPAPGAIHEGQQVEFIPRSDHPRGARAGSVRARAPKS